MFGILGNRLNGFCGPVSRGLFLGMIGFMSLYVCPSKAQGDRIYRQKSLMILNAKKIRDVGLRESLPGVETRFDTNQKDIALTLDLCDGSGTAALDQLFVDFLSHNQIKATIFVSGRWARKNRSLLATLAQNKLFSIQNHGLDHKPASSKPRVVYGIQSTRSLSGVFDEVMRNHEILRSITGREPLLFRSGTAHYDDQAVALIKSLGYRIIGYNVLPGDAAFPQNRHKMVQNLQRATPGSIILMHLNHPRWQSRAAFEQVYPWFKQNGFRFVHLVGS